jgi:hypothetical protein
MKSAIKLQLALSLGLFAVGNAGALSVAATISDGQEQARLLLAGRGASQYKSGFLSSPSIVGKSIATDAQTQAREMILGRQIAKSPISRTYESRTGDSRDDRKGAVDPHELARRMILGDSAGTSGKIRLTSKPH